MARRETHRGAATEVDMVAQVVDYAIITLDVDGLVRTWNAGAERVKGYAAEGILGRSFENFYSAEDRAHGRTYPTSSTSSRGAWRVATVGRAWGWRASRSSWRCTAGR